MKNAEARLNEANPENKASPDINCQDVGDNEDQNNKKDKSTKNYHNIP